MASTLGGHTLAFAIAVAGSLIELIAAIGIGWHIVLTVLSIARREGSDRARAIVADGVLAALGFAVAGTLLKTLALESWPEIRAFAVVFVLRSILKRVFKHEETRTIARGPGPCKRSGLLPAEPQRRIAS